MRTIVKQIFQSLGVVVILGFVSIGTSHAQTYTNVVWFDDPCYMHQPLLLPDSVGIAGPVIPLGYFAFRYIPSAPTTVYGIALTAETALPDSSYSINLYVTDHNGGLIHLDSFLYTAEPVQRQFQYRGLGFVAPNVVDIDSVIVPSFEYYFPKPYTISDTFYVGIKHPVYSMAYVVYGMQAGASVTVTTMADYHSYMFQGTLIDNPSAHTQTNIGGMVFPIVDIPCPRPEPPIIYANINDSVFMQWQVADTALYQLLFETADSGRSETFITGELYDNHYIFSEQLPEGWYTVRLRQACNSSVPGHTNTFIWSEWSYAVRFHQGPGGNSGEEPEGIGSVDESAFAVSPNPTGDRVTVTLTEPADEATRLELCDLAGRRLTVQRVAPGASTAVLSLEELPAGAYLLRLASPQGSSTRHILKQ